jgi:hypothetical protein
METVQFSELTDDVQTFVRQALASEGLVVKDESGRPYGSFVPFVEAPPPEQEKAWRRIRQLQAKVALHMQEEGASEEDLDRCAVTPLAGVATADNLTVLRVSPNRPPSPPGMLGA